MQLYAVTVRESLVSLSKTIREKIYSVHTVNSGCGKRADFNTLPTVFELFRSWEDKWLVIIGVESKDLRALKMQIGKITLGANDKLLSAQIYVNGL